MRNFQRKRGWSNIVRSKPVLIFLGILVLFFAWSVFGFIGKMEITRENRKIAENKVAELEKDKAKLSADIARLETEEGVEESIREKFGLVKEGENLIVVIDNKENADFSNETKPNWFILFFNRWFK